MNPYPETTRRAFLRATLALAGLGLTGCTFERRDLGGRSSGEESGIGSRPAEAVVIRRPVVVPFHESVRIASPLALLPAAYVSMASREVFVDREFRDRASWLLDAHISVSTWVWRIRLPGDSPRTPIPPGDEPREFEERPIGAWDPGSTPSVGDIRIVAGRLVDTTMEFGCVPVQASDERLTAGPIRFESVLAGPGEPIREDFGMRGAGERHRDPECGTGTPTAVDIFGWAHRG